MTPPISVHSGWRTGSTYIWSKFRELPECMTFYEPFHEVLASLTEATLPVWHPGQWDSGHPELAQPYFAEYRPLMASGVHGFHPDFTARNYFVTDAARLGDQAAYLDSLQQLSRRQHKRPVFNFCRSLGRMAWLCRTVPGTHVLLVRNPCDQWLSGYQQTQKGNPYFEVMPYLLLGHAATHPVLGGVAEHWGIPRSAEEGSFADTYQQYEAVVGLRPATHSFGVFLDWYLYTFLAALPFVDIVLDMDRLARVPAYRQAASTAFADTLHVTLSWDDARLTQYPLDARPKLWQAMIGDALARLERHWLPSMLRTTPALRAEHVQFVIQTVREEVQAPRMLWEPGTRPPS